MSKTDKLKMFQKYSKKHTSLEFGARTMSV